MNKKLLLIFGIIFIIATIAIGFLLTQQQTPIIKTAEVTLTIHPSPDFTLVVTPEHIDSFPDRVVPYNASVTSVNNFAGEVIFSVSGLPPEIIVTYFPSNTLTLGPDAPKGVQINVEIPLNQALVGDYTITVTAESTQYN